MESGRFLKKAAQKLLLCRVMDVDVPMKASFCSQKEAFPLCLP
jgi:hypothetical protein